MLGLILSDPLCMVLLLAVLATLAVLVGLLVRGEQDTPAPPVVRPPLSEAVVALVEATRERPAVLPAVGRAPVPGGRHRARAGR